MSRSLSSRIPFLLAASLFVGLTALRAQAPSLQFQVANLTEDVRLLDERLRQMSIQLEDMRRENNRLRETVAAYESAAESNLAKFATVSQLEEALRQAVAALEKRDELLKREVVADVGKTVDAFAKKVNSALKGVSGIAPPDPTVKNVFSTEGIPTEGTPYTVAPGDSISSIAQKLNSRVDWIQNINKISDPRLLQVGQMIFVPQESN